MVTLDGGTRVGFDGGTRVGENGVDDEVVVGSVTGDTVVVMFSNNVVANGMRVDDRVDDRMDDVAFSSDDGLAVDMISIDLNNTNPTDTCLLFLSLQFSI